MERNLPIVHAVDSPLTLLSSFSKPSLYVTLPVLELYIDQVVHETHLPLPPRHWY